MKALIFNSGTGTRMGELTQNTHKSLVMLNSGETIFERQIRILSECGVQEFIITTGPYADKLKSICTSYPNLIFKFVHNELYNRTNYIYSFYLTKEYLDDDFIMLHGDLVFNKKLVIDLINHPNHSVGLINKSLVKPSKDFKGRVINGIVKEIRVDIFDDNCYAFQPLYKLSCEDIRAWWNNVSKFIHEKNDKVYAENALNQITDKVIIVAMDYDNYFVDEIDNIDDYRRVVSRIRLYDFDEQEQINSLDILSKLENPLVVIDSFLRGRFKDFKLFSEFQSNPLYEDVMKGVKAFEGCDLLVSIGGGSAIDVAKAIKYYSCLDENGHFVYKNIKHIAIPTTAGTGSESTRYAVIYKDTEKLSLTHDAIFPDMVVLVPEFLKTLPIYQKKCTLLDALCQSIESIWSINATEKSISYARESIQLIKTYYKEYIDGDENIIFQIQKAANLSGKAINISQTTAAHALSYKITSFYHIPHGHAVALNIPFLWSMLIRKNCEALKHANITIDEFEEIVDSIGIAKKIIISDDEIEMLAKTVNLKRLANFPIELSIEDIKEAYKSISVID